MAMPPRAPGTHRIAALVIIASAIVAAFAAGIPTSRRVEEHLSFDIAAAWRTEEAVRVPPSMNPKTALDVRMELARDLVARLQRRELPLASRMTTAAMLRGGPDTDWAGSTAEALVHRLLSEGQHQLVEDMFARCPVGMFCPVFAELHEAGRRGEVPGGAMLVFRAYDRGTPSAREAIGKLVSWEFWCLLDQNHVPLDDPGVVNWARRWYEPRQQGLFGNFNACCCGSEDTIDSPVLLSLNELVARADLSRPWSSKESGWFWFNPSDAQWQHALCSSSSGAQPQVMPEWFDDMRSSANAGTVVKISYEAPVLVGNCPGALPLIELTVLATEEKPGGRTWSARVRVVMSYMRARYVGPAASSPN